MVKWWHLLAIPICGVALWELGMLSVHQLTRLELYDQAEKYARERNKPFLVVGKPMGMYGCGDVNLDIRPSKECPVFVQADVEDLYMFKDKQFGSVFASHVLEHVYDIEKAFKELDRIADKTYIAHPFWYSLQKYIPYDHKWIIYSAPPVTEYIEYRPIAGRNLQ